MSSKANTENVTKKSQQQVDDYQNQQHTHTHTRTPSNITEQCSKCIYADNNTVITHSIGNRVKQKWLWLYCLDYSKAKPEWLLNNNEWEWEFDSFSSLLFHKYVVCFYGKWVCPFLFVINTIYCDGCMTRNTKIPKQYWHNKANADYFVFVELREK